MTFNPDVVVEIAFNAGYATAAASRTWTDVSTYVEAQNAISIQRGRQDEFSDVQPSRATIVLDNRDGRFTPGYTSGAYYPNVLKGRPVRVTATWSAVTYRRFLGYIDEWDVEWPDGSDGKPIVTITASSRSATFGRHTLRSVVEQDILQDDPTAYFTMGDPVGSTLAANTSGYTQTPLGMGGQSVNAAVFGSSTGPPTDGLTAVQFTDSNQYLAATTDTPVQTSGSTARSFELWFNTSAAGSHLGSVGNESGTDYVEAKQTAGTLTVAYIVSGSFVWSTSPAGTYNDGLTHHLAVVETVSGGTISASLYVDGALADTGSGAGSFVNHTRIMAGALPDDTGAFGNSVIAHLAVYDSALSSTRVSQHALSGSTGFLGETSDARVQRLAGYIGIPSAEVSTETGVTTSMAFVDTTGQTADQALLDTVHTENGLLFDAGDGTLTFHARSHRYTTTSSLTLSAATQKVEADFAPKLDDQGVINDATYTGSSGVAYRSVDATSVAAIGTYSDSTEILTTNDYEVADRANFTTYIYGDPITRVPAASVLLTVQSSGDITSLLGLELGTQITISGLPSQAPASSMDFFIEGIAESIAFENYLMTFTLSPALNELDVFTVQDATFGQYDAYPLSY